jgi:uncharacterized protein (TIGR02145 family)
MTRLLLLVLLLCGCITSKHNNTKIKKFVDPRDGECYTYVEIDDRYWMRENMRYNVPGSKLNPNNPSHLYGRLYNWEQAMKACPEGWRLSTDIDWMSLERIFIPEMEPRFIEDKYRGNHGKKLKSKQDWDTSGTDSLRLNILPTGYYGEESGKYSSLGLSTIFWTSTSHIWGGKAAEKFAYTRVIANGKDGLLYTVHGKKLSYLSCRCVKDIENNPYLDL